MPNSESKLTPAQAELVHFCTQTDAGCLFKSLSLTLGLSITHYIPDAIGDPSRSSPTEKTLEAWYFTLSLMEVLHNLATESLAG